MNVAEVWERYLIEIRGLNLSSQVGAAVFSTARCARFYREYCLLDCTDPRVLEEVVEVGWSALSTSPQQSQLESLRTRLESAADECESRDSPVSAAAQEACFAGLVLIEILMGSVSPEQTMRVFAFTRDIVDMMVQESREFEEATDEIEASILSAPMMRDELDRHGKALALLQQGTFSIDTLRSLASGK
jgi:hypothetical protein